MPAIAETPFYRIAGRRQCFSLIVLIVWFVEGLRYDFVLAIVHIVLSKDHSMGEHYGL